MQAQFWEADLAPPRAFSNTVVLDRVPTERTMGSDTMLETAMQVLGQE
ncbi:MAG: hypothetical protein L0Y80_01810 [Ignavibacteriae bacterium]|nr:hypothetical protein [Ignavibacteriota bacterium]